MGETEDGAGVAERKMKVVYEHAGCLAQRGGGLALHGLGLRAELGSVLQLNAELRLEHGHHPHVERGRWDVSHESDRVAGHVFDLIKAARLSPQGIAVLVAAKNLHGPPVPTSSSEGLIRQSHRHQSSPSSFSSLLKIARAVSSLISMCRGTGTSCVPTTHFVVFAAARHLEGEPRARAAARTFLMRAVRFMSSV